MLVATYIWFNLYIFIFVISMKEKIIIAPSNKSALKFLKSFKDKKSQIQKHFAQPGSKLSSLKVSFFSLNEQIL